jgi:hypothetical protein
MEALKKQPEVTGLPPNVGSWSAVGIPGFVAGILNRWARELGGLPRRFVLVACPKVEINAIGGLPSRVRELTTPRHRLQHFTGCHKPYLVILLEGEDADARRDEIQKWLSWSEGYQVEYADGLPRLHFVEAIEERDDEDLAMQAGAGINLDR